MAACDAFVGGDAAASVVQFVAGIEQVAADIEQVAVVR
jgi:hypothetical protein